MMDYVLYMVILAVMVFVAYFIFKFFPEICDTIKAGYLLWTDEKEKKQISKNQSGT